MHNKSSSLLLIELLLPCGNLNKFITDEKGNEYQNRLFHRFTSIPIGCFKVSWCFNQKKLILYFLLLLRPGYTVNIIYIHTRIYS